MTRILVAFLVFLISYAFISMKRLGVGPDYLLNIRDKDGRS